MNQVRVHYDSGNVFGPCRVSINVVIGYVLNRERFLRCLKNRGINYTGIVVDVGPTGIRELNTVLVVDINSDPVQERKHLIGIT